MSGREGICDDAMRSNPEAHKHSVKVERTEEQATVVKVAEEAKKGMRTKATVVEDEVMRRKKEGKKGEEIRWRKEGSVVE